LISNPKPLEDEDESLVKEECIPGQSSELARVVTQVSEQMISKHSEYKKMIVHRKPFGNCQWDHVDIVLKEGCFAKSESAASHRLWMRRQWNVEFCSI
jgi:hypothetical protein